MQRDLIARGLLTSDLWLTDAGNAYVDQLIEQLKSGQLQAATNRKGKRIKWNRRRGIDNQHAGLAPAPLPAKIAPLSSGSISEGVSP